MYIASIINLLSWPLMIAVSYFIIRYIIKVYEKRQETPEDQSS